MFRLPFPGNFDGAGEMRQIPKQIVSGGGRGRREGGQGHGLELHAEKVGLDIIKRARKCCLGVMLWTVLES